MELNPFTLGSAMILLLPIALALVAGAFEPGAAVWRRLGAAVLQGDAEPLFSLDSSRLWFQNLDGASFHHAMLAMLLAGIIGTSLRAASVVAIVMISALVAGLLFPVAAKLIWFGPLRRAGLIDIGGATVLLSLGGALTTTAMRLCADRWREGQTSEFIRATPAATGVAGMLLVVGWCALLATAGVMQSPATPISGMLNGLRAMTVAAVVAMVLAKVLRREFGPLGVLGAISLAAACTSAVAGRVPVGSAVAVGLIVGVIGSPLIVSARQILARGPAGDFSVTVWLGGLIATLLAVPYGRDPDSMLVQLLVQLSGFAICSGMGICAAILFSTLVRLSAWRPRDQPIAAS